MMDLLQAQTPASKLVLHVIVLPHLSTVRHHNLNYYCPPPFFNKHFLQ